MRGAVCPTPLGTYRYRKRKGSGASLMADVEVFPLAVNEELPDWKERSSASGAGSASARPPTRSTSPTCATSFAPSTPANSTRRPPDHGMLSLVAEKSKVGPMFAWFQRLLPKTGGFFELFEAHAVA